MCEISDFSGSFSGKSIMTIHKMRRTYTSGGLDVSNAAADPVEQFQKWFQDAVDTSPGEWFEANAMTLATASKGGHATARIVLLKGFEECCPIFFTNYLSEKGVQMAENPFATLCFYWAHCERQIRIEGHVERVSAELSDQYFASRPRGSQLGALVSQQSAVVASREFLEQRLAELESQYGESPIPRPPHWGGYRLLPEKYEFWQGRENRLHDRIVYSRSEGETGNPWTLSRLSP